MGEYGERLVQRSLTENNHCVLDHINTVFKTLITHHYRALLRPKAFNAPILQIGMKGGGGGMIGDIPQNNHCECSNMMLLQSVGYTEYTNSASGPSTTCDRPLLSTRQTVPHTAVSNINPLLAFTLHY